MQVSSIVKSRQGRPGSQSVQTGTADFSKFLDTPVAQSTKAEQTPKTSEGSQSSKIALGTISASTPTVSHLLLHHPDWGKTVWHIVHAEVNRDKAFTTMRPGTTVYIDVETQEISWGRDAERAVNVPLAMSPRPSALHSAIVFTKPDHTALTDTDPEPTVEVTPQPIRLGTISQHEPTVSHLLNKHPETRRDIWDIVFAAPNRHKDFTHLRPGTTVFLYPATRELRWQDEPMRHPVLSQATATPAVQADQRQHDHTRAAFVTDLANAVKPLYGTSYKKIDCYELLVHGLQELGVRYQGKGGLREQLVQTAVDQGLPENAYLNGEGLIQALGSPLYSRRVGSTGGLDTRARQIFREMEPLLEKGLILAFSTRTRGHTGIISSSHGTWTFINSGVMDHPIDASTSAWQVGEEVLHEEVSHWLRLADDRQESLQVTLGRLDETKLPTDIHPRPADSIDIL